MSDLLPPHVLESKIPPPALWLMVGLLMWLTSLAAPGFHFLFSGRSVAALCLGLLGAAISISGLFSFRRARTTVNPLKPGSASSLVVSGIYKRTRNPMYLGLLLALLGWAMFLSNALAFVWIPAFVFYINRFQIGPEERALASLFEQDFLKYKSKVRRWI